jgi:hypothetical protein
VKERVRKAAAWLADDRKTVPFAIVVGVALLKFGLEGLERRVSALESRGWVPVDDLATVGDLVNLEGRLTAGGEVIEASAEEVQPATEPGTP